MRYFLLVVFLMCGNYSVSAQKKVLDHDAYDIWQVMKDKEISQDGNWVLYVHGAEDGDDTLRVRHTVDETNFTFARAGNPIFTYNSRYVIAKISPAKATVKAAKKAKKKKEEMPKDSLLIVNLQDGSHTIVDNIKSFAVPEKNGQWLAYLLEKMPEKPDTTIADSLKETEKEAEKPKSKEKKSTPKEGKEKKDGNILVLHRLEDGQTWRYENVVEYQLAKTGVALAFTASSKDSTADGAFAVLTSSLEKIPVLSGAGDYKQLALSESGELLAFLSNRDSYREEQPSFNLYFWSFDGLEALRLAGAADPAFPENWWISEHGKLSFSKSGKRLFFSSAPRPEPVPETETPADEQVNVDIWHWQDPDLMTVQLKNREKDLKQGYLAMADIPKKRIVQLATTAVPEVDVASEGDSEFALGKSMENYRREVSWDFPEYYDYYLIDIKNGRQQKVLEKIQWDAELSPAGNYLYWWDRSDSSWYALDVKRKNQVNLTKTISQRFNYEPHDWLYLPGPWGVAGWTADDKSILIYDEFDIWACDPSGKTPPRCITEGQGRSANLRFRYIRLDREERFIPSNASLLLSAFNTVDKSEGFFRDSVTGNAPPQRLLQMPRNFSRPQKAQQSDRLLFTRENFQEFPDLWVSDLAFENMTKVSDLNPQQGQYNWGTVELIEWRSLDGELLNGLLYKPEDFDIAKKYPLMVYFYEKNSDNLHRHYAPAPHRSVINHTFYASRGYMIFVPDIPYDAGYPGESALKAVLPGVTYLQQLGNVDAENIGVQGHSWGGYQIAYLVTRTHIFKAAEAGAPVANMFSAYGGIRWETGLSRMFQYERTQSRIGGTIWEYPLRYIENSPLFWADKIQTPLLIMHNDQDGHVPWYQGIELFVALRRLDKPVWLINYSGEPHWPLKYHKKVDWQIRLQQYFDHFLKGAPAPVWLEKGVPAIQKGKTLGLEPAKSDWR